MHSSVAGLIAQVITTILSRAGYAGLCGLMAIESACIPLPSEIILPFAGYMVSTLGTDESVFVALQPLRRNRLQYPDPEIA